MELCKSRVDIIGVDSVVVGGSIAGLAAAIRLAERGCNVALVEKGTVGWSGCGVFAGGLYLLPVDGLEDLWLKELVIRGEYLNDQEWVKRLLEDCAPLSRMIEDWAARDGSSVFVRDGRGELMQRRVSGNSEVSFTFVRPSVFLSVLRKEAVRRGVKLVERTMLVDILRHGERVAGVVGYRYRENDLIVIKAKAVVLATGGCTFKSPFGGGSAALTGDGLAAGIRLGLEVVNLENGFFNASAKDYDVCGIRCGRLLNGVGEEFLWHYDGELGPGTTLQRSVLAMAFELRRGKGPLYCDMSALSEQERAVNKGIVPRLARLESEGLLERPLEWVPVFMGTICSGGGIRITTECQTGVEGLYAAGDVTNVPPHGTYSVPGLNYSFALVSGWAAGEGAARYCGESGRSIDVRISDEDVSASFHNLLRLLSREKGIEPAEVSTKLRTIVGSLDVGLLKHEQRLRRALLILGDLEQEADSFLKARDAHEAVKALGCMNMLLIAKLFLRASLVRSESRGFHYRDDFPMTDNDNWMKWVVIRYIDGIIEAATEEIPTPYVSPKPGIASG